MESQLITLIKGFYSETNNERRQDFESRIYSFLQKVDQAVPLLLSIIQNNNEREVVSSSMIFLKKINYDMMSDEVSDGFKRNCMEMLMSDRDYETKKKIAKIMEYSITPRMSTGRKLFISLKKDFMDFLEKIVEKEEFSEKDIIALLLLIKVLYKVESKFGFEKMFQRTHPILNKIYNRNIKLILDNLEDSQFNSNKIVIDEVRRICESYLVILELYVSIIKKGMMVLVLLDSEIESLDTFRNTAKNPVFVANILEILFFKIGNLSKNSQNIIYDITAFEGLNGLLNKIKFKALFIMDLLFINFLKSEKKKKNQLEVMYKSLIKILLESLYIYYQHNTNLDEIKHNNYLKKLITKSINIFSNALVSFDFFQIFSDFKKVILSDILLLNFVTLPDEYDNIEHDPTEFVNYTVSLIAQEKCVFMKQYFQKFMQKMCKYIDGVLTYVVKLLLEILTFCLEEKGLHREFEFLKDVNNSAFFSKTDGDMKIDLCLLVLTFLYNQICERADLVDLLDIFVKKYAGALVVKNELIRMRFVFLIAETIREIPKNDLPLKINLLRFILESGKNSQLLELATIQNLFVISNENFHQLSQEDFDKEILNAYTCVLLKEIETKNKIEKNLECLQYVLKKKTDFLTKHPELFKQIIAVISNRIFIEDSNKAENSKKKEEIINQLWNTLKLVFDLSQLILQYQEFSEENLSRFIPLLFCSENENQIKNWDEDLFECYNNFVHLTKRLPQNAENFFNIFPAILKAYKNRITILRPLLNSFIHFQPDFFNAQNSDTFLGLINNCLFTHHEYELEESYVVDAILLLQVFIQTRGPQLSQNQFYFCLQIHKKLLDCVTDKNSCVSLESLDKIDGVFLSLFFSVPEKCWAAYSFEDVEKHVLRIFDFCLVFETFYETKLLILGLTCLFEKGIQLCGERIEFFAKVISFLVIHMKFVQNLEIVRYYDKLKEKNEGGRKRGLREHEKRFYKIHNTLLDILPSNKDQEIYSDWFRFKIDQNKEKEQHSENSENDLDFYYYENKHLYKKKLTSSIFSPILFLDEFKHFGEIFWNFKSMLNGEYYQKVREFFENDVENFVVGVAFRTRYIKINENPCHFRIRKFLKYKRHN